MSTLRYAILGLLAREPMSGYDVAQRLKLPIGYFWQASHSQIYPELDKLQRDKLVTHRVVQQRSRPDKKIFSITPAGRSALAAWVLVHPEPAPVREEMLLKTYSSWIVDRTDAAAFYRAAEREQRAHLAELEGVERHLREKFGKQMDQPGTEGFASYATLRAGLVEHAARADWFAWLADSLERGKPKR